MITNDWLPGDGYRKVNIGPRALGAPRASRAQREREREREIVAGWLAGWLAWLAGLKAIRTNRNPMFFIYSGLRLWLAGWLAVWLDWLV